MAEPADRVIGHGLLRAASKAGNLCFAGLVAGSSALMHSWALLGVSVAGYATLVAWDLSRLGFWKRVLKDLRGRPPSLPDPDLFADLGARHFVNRLYLARTELRRVLDGSDGPVPGPIAAQLEALPEVERRALALVGRLEQLGRYLADKNLRTLRNDLERLRRAAEATSNERLRHEYRKAQVTVEGEVAALEEIAGARDLVTARLETLCGSLEMFPCEIVRLRTIDADSREHADPGFDPGALRAAAEPLWARLAPDDGGS
jgi:hypothetical protein